MTNKLKYADNFKYVGIEDSIAKFVEEKQLCDAELWQLATEQFAGQPDICDNGWRGEYWGKLMRGACMTYQYTKSESLYCILEKSAKEMLLTQDSKGRFTTYGDTTEFNGWDMWSRKYVMLGFLHFYEICKDESLKTKIITAVRKHLDYIIEKVGDKSGQVNITDTSDIWQGINSSSILEPVVMLYNITQDQRYIEFAKYIIDNGGAKEFNIFEAAYENRLHPCEYPVLKAYEMMSCFEGLIEYYKVTDEEKWLVAAENFVRQMINTEITIIGCAGCEHECLNNSVLMQTYTKYEGLMQETCVTVTWIKLCFKLLCLTGKSMYADEIEKSAYNALYGAVNTQNKYCDSESTFDFPWFRDVYNVHHKDNCGQIFDSYSPLRRGIRGRAVGGFRPMRNNTRYIGCCIAIGAAGTALVPLSSVMASQSGAVFVLYPNGEVGIGDMKFTIASGYPSNGKVKIIVGTKTECDYEIKLRIPAFAKNTQVFVNGEQKENVIEGEFFSVVRKWETDDIIELDIDMLPRIEYGKKNPRDERSEKYIAVLNGPLVMARDARISDVGRKIKYTKGNISITHSNTATFDTMCELEVEIDNCKFKAIDYASAGKTWSYESEFEAWLETENCSERNGYSDEE